MREILFIIHIFVFFFFPGTLYIEILVWISFGYRLFSYANVPGRNFAAENSWYFDIHVDGCFKNRHCHRVRDRPVSLGEKSCSRVSDGSVPVYNHFRLGAGITVSINTTRRQTESYKISRSIER